MSSEFPDGWIEVGCVEPLRIKSHYHQYSSVWFDNLNDAWEWLWKCCNSEKPVDTPKEEGVKQDQLVG